MKSILIVDDDAAVLESLSRFFRQRGWTVSGASDATAGVAMFEQDAPSVVISDLLLPDFSGVQLVATLRARDPHATVVLLTGYGDVATAVEAMKAGAENFLMKPVDLDHLELTAERAREKVALRLRAVHANPGAAGSLEGIADVFGPSPVMQRLGEQVRLLAAGTAPVLLSGETGTGKGWLARQLHALSPRAAGPFVEINCAGLSSTFLSSELFGHERGAFTDARHMKHGLFEVADGGTLFLDEIGDLAIELQPKLLTALESRRFRRLGGTHEITTDVRLVAATNVDLRRAVRDREFRADLYYRLAVVPLELPPLRERGRSEIARLVTLTVAALRREIGRGPDRVSDAALDALTRYAWPGNIRELRNVLERAMLLGAHSPDISLTHLPHELWESAGVPVDATETTDLSLCALERAHILRVLALSSGNKAHAARALGITRNTLYAKLRECGVDMDVTDERDAGEHQVRRSDA